jgi:predicted nucleic acid-binding protein
MLLGKDERLRQRLSDVGASKLVTSCFTAAELFFAAESSKRVPPNRRRVESFLETIQPVPFEKDALRIFGRLQAEAGARRASLGSFDLAKVSIALATHRILVTGNERRLRSIPSLRLENWLA